MGSILECGTGMLDIDTLLANNERKWKIIANRLTIDRQKDVELQRPVTDSFWFLYMLQPIGHSLKPEAGTKLQVTAVNSLLAKIAAKQTVP